MSKSKLSLILFILWSLVVLGFFHRSGFDESLRYTRVAEGNISKVVHGIWAGGIQNYLKVLKNDADIWGRIRPFHWIYYNAPFLITLLRNGDLFRDDPNVQMADRINGDLQTHVIFLIGTLSIAVGAAVWLIWRIFGALWVALLLPFYIGASYILNENLIVYHSDSGEIGQLLFISLYLLGISISFSGEPPKTRYEIFASVCLVLAYAMKETTVVLFPVIFGVLGIQVLPVFGCTIKFKNFVFRHIALHIFLLITLIVLVHMYKSGAYASNYNLLNQRLITNFKISWLVLSSLGVPVIPFMLGCLMFLAGLKRRKFKNIREKWIRNEGKFLFTICTVGLFLAFWLINLPWKPQMAKYYLPALFFVSIAAVSIQASIYQHLKTKGFKFSAVLWLAFCSFFILIAAGNNYSMVSNNYKYEYRFRGSIPLIAKQIASGITNHNVRKILIIPAPPFQEGTLPFKRHINLIHGLNIAQNGQITQHAKAIEQNYFRLYPSAPTIEIVTSEHIPDHINADEVYVFENKTESKKSKQLKRLGFRRTGEWRFGHAILRLKRYIREFPKSGRAGKI